MQHVGTYNTAGSGSLLHSISFLHDQGFELDVTTPLTFNPKIQEAAVLMFAHTHKSVLFACGKAASNRVLLYHCSASAGLAASERCALRPHGSFYQRHLDQRP